VVTKKAVPCCILPCLSAPFKKEEIPIPIEIIAVIIVKGRGIYNFPFITHSFTSLEGVLPKGHIFTQEVLNKKKSELQLKHLSVRSSQVLQLFVQARHYLLGVGTEIAGQVS
jgi:hypothetical protein